MNAEKANIQNSMDVAEIPEYVFESLAQSLLPVIQKYYESEDGKQDDDNQCHHRNGVLAKTSPCVFPVGYASAILNKILFFF